MASITRDPNGRKRILFVAPDKKRKAIRLGKVPQRAAEAIKFKVEQLLAAKVSGCGWDNETARWVAELPEELADKLAAAGLIPARKRATLAAFLDGYIAKRDGVDVKPATVTVWRHVRRNLVDYFGAEKPLREITPGDAEDWRRWLSQHEDLAENTVRKRCQFAKMFLGAAVKHRLIERNPLVELKGKVQSNPARAYFISRDEARKVLNACPDGQWRLIFALSRFAGLRCPSEHLALRWGDVDWDRNRVTVWSPKTEHHAGGESRQIPIFPELRPYLEEVWEQAEPGTEYVITRYRSSNANLRTQLLRIIKRAGLTPWPKLFHNLRATRETELAAEYPLHVVCTWIGNSQLIAARHYLQVTDADFDRAAEGSGKAAHNAAQYAHESGRTARQARRENPAIPGEYEGLRSHTHHQADIRGHEPRGGGR